MMLVRPLTTVTKADVAQVGGKAAALGELLHAGYRVAPGFVVTAEASALTPELSRASPAPKPPRAS